MENETFRSKVANMVARTRKALRLYSIAGKYSPQGNFKDVQAAQWRDITSDLLKDLSSAVQKAQSVKNLSAAVFTIRDKFNSMWRTIEAEIHVMHKDLLVQSEAGEYVRAALISANLVAAKARFQASQAAHHELEELIKSSHYAHDPIELTNPMEIEPHDFEVTEVENDAHKSVANFSGSGSRSRSKPAKVIPIRKVL